MELNDNKPRYSKKPQHVPEDVVGRLVPRAVEVEAAVLGALMIEKNAYTNIADLLKPESFYEPRHQHVFEAIQTLGLEQKPIDMMTVVNQMREDGTLEKVGGAAFVVGLTQNVASAAHVEFHARIVAQKYLARELISFASKVENSAFDESNDVDDILQEAERNLFEISQGNVKKEVSQIDPLINKALERMQLASKRDSGLSGLSSGFRDLDKYTSGWQNSDLIIIAARPAMGKTAFVLSMALNIALHNNPIAVFSLEMSNVQLVNRLISNVCEIPGDKIMSGNLSQLEWQQLLNRLQKLKGLPLFVDDTSGLTIMELRSKARRLVREHQVKMIVIDYLQLMSAGIRMGSREQEVSTISRFLKQLAKELDIPIVALSQLNRKLEDRGNKDKRPQLSDLRESGAIEQDADIVCFIHRPEYYSHASENSEGTRDIRGLAEFIIAKHRSGGTGTVDLRFRNELVRFENWEPNSGDATYGMRAASDNNETEVPQANPENAAKDAEALGLGSPSSTPNESFLSHGADDTPF